MTKTKTVVIGMSGGVDSSVSAYLLKKQGYHVIGMFMKNWEEKDGQGVCKASKEFEDVVKVCEALEIPYYSVNFSEEYLDLVFSHFLEELKLGHTPNPDILCNREIKFKTLFEKALSLGADYLATGHYCRTEKINGKYHLLRGIDPGKDQSYFLYTIQEPILQKTLFPIGHLTKKEVRDIAKEAGLSTHDKKDSTGICFIGKRNFKDFVHNYLPFEPGNFETSQGKVIGKHDGVAYYTIGQRKGLNIGGPGEAWFVVGKDVKRNVVYVEQGAEHPLLYKKELFATEWSWVNEMPSIPYSCTAKIRYRQQDSNCVIESLQEEKMHVVFDSPQRAVTPRQSIVFYNGEICLGGAMIS